MNELRETIGKNLTYLRKKNRLTQMDLALKLSYSDKAISKWEHGEALPSIENLMAICAFYGITLDQLVHDGIESQKDISSTQVDRTNKIIITGLAMLLIWLIATIFYVGDVIFYDAYYWQLFIDAIPLSFLILLIFNSIWGKTKLNYTIISGLVWTVIAAVYCTFGNYRMWMMFILGIPSQLIIILWSRLKSKRHINRKERQIS